jgi:hypothetical protein
MVGVGDKQDSEARPQKVQQHSDIYYVEFMGEKYKNLQKCAQDGTAGGIVD